jgi:hypothetical protein
MASLVLSGTIRGEPAFVPGSASIGSDLAGKMTVIGLAGYEPPQSGRLETARALCDVPDLATCAWPGHEFFIASLLSAELQSWHSGPKLKME